MKLLQRVLVAIALAVWLAMPILGNDGGDNAGGTGIWILPRAGYLAANSQEAVAREQRNVPSFGQDLQVAVSSECGACGATFLDEVSGQPVALQSVGGVVRIPAALLQSLPQGDGTKAHIVISDASQLGYLMRVERREDGSLVVKVL